MRALSNPEYDQFTQDEASVISNMWPGQSKLVSWGGLSVLVLIGQNPINIDGLLYPDVYLSDVSDAPQLAAMQQANFSAPPQSMLDTLPQAIQDTIADDAAAAGKLLNQAGDAITAVLAKTGGAIGAGLKPVVSSLTVPLVIIGAIVALMYLPKRS
jgi:hypothetical protein